jgi:NitT/TauT family transport system permease protein
VSSVVDEASSGPKLARGFLASPAARSLIGGLAAAAAWLAVAVLITYWPDKPDSDWAYTEEFTIALALAAFAGIWFAGLQSVRRLAPWLIALALFLAAWETVTAKLGLLPLPFFPPPQAILEVVVDDRARLGACIFASFRLLAIGYFLGAAVGS